MLNQRRTSKGKVTRPARSRSAEQKTGNQASGVQTRVQAQVVKYVMMVVSLIEGRRVSRQSIVRLLAKLLRQHSMCSHQRIGQTGIWSNEEPP